MRGRQTASMPWSLVLGAGTRALRAGDPRRGLLTTTTTTTTTTTDRDRDRDRDRVRFCSGTFSIYQVYLLRVGIDIEHKK